MTLLRAPALLLTLAMLGWAGNILLGRAMHAEFTPTSLSFARWLCAFVLLLPLTARGLWAKRAVLRRDWAALVALGLLGVGAFNWLLYQAVRTTTATNAALIYTYVPVFIVAVSWVFLGERIRLRQGVGIAVSSLGVLAIITRGDPALLLHWQFTPGDLWALSTVPVWGLYTIWLRRRPQELQPLEFMSMLILIGLMVLTPAFLIERAQGVRVQWDWRTLGTVAYLAVVASIVSFVLWNAGVQRMGANRAGLYTHLYPLFTAVLAVAFLGEDLHVYHLGGAALIFAGLYLATLASTVPDAAPAAAPDPEPPQAAASPASSAGKAGEAAEGARWAPLRSLWRVLSSPYLLLVLNMLLWSGNWIIGRGLRGEVTPLGLNFWRWTLALAWLLPFTWPDIWAARAAVLREWKVLLALGVLGIGLFNFLVYLAVSHTTAVNAVLISSVQPVAIVVFSWLLLREGVTARQAVGIGVSLFGVLAILCKGDPVLLLQVEFNVGDLWSLIAMPVWALYSVLLRRRPPELRPMTLLTVLIAIGVAVQAPFALWLYADSAWINLSPDTGLALLYTALGPSLLGVSLYNYGVSRLGPNVAGLFLHLVPAFATGLAWLLLGEALELYHGFGVLLIFSGIYLATIAGRTALAVQPATDQVT